MNMEEKVNAIINYILAQSEEEREKVISFLQKSKSETVYTKNLEDEIADILCEIGIPEHILGHRYVSYAIKVVVENPDILDAVTSELYPTVAEKFNTNGSRAERAIRRAVECAWDRYDTEVIAKYFGSTISASKGKPTNSEFIARVANIVRRRMRNA